MTQTQTFPLCKIFQDAVFSDPHIPVQRQNLGFCLYTGITGQRKPVFWNFLHSVLSEFSDIAGIEIYKTAIETDLRRGAFRILSNM